MFKQLEEESSHGGCDSYEEVNNDEENIGCAGNLEPERSWIHDGGYGPAGGNKITTQKYQYHWSKVINKPDFLSKYL